MSKNRQAMARGSTAQRVRASFYEVDDKTDQLCRAARSSEKMLSDKLSALLGIRSNDSCWTETPAIAWGPSPLNYFLLVNGRLKIIKAARFGYCSMPLGYHNSCRAGRKGKGDGKMGTMRIYQVVIDSSDGQETYRKDYVGPATSNDDAVRRAWTVFKRRADDRVVAVEQVDQNVWDEDVAALPPDGPECLPS